MRYILDVPEMPEIGRIGKIINNLKKPSNYRKLAVFKKEAKRLEKEEKIILKTKNSRFYIMS